MAEYIEREAAIAYLENHKRVSKEQSFILSADEDAIIKFLKEKCPTADAVVVVRCEDCRYCLESDKTNRIFCTYHGDGIEFETYPNEYCGHGVRRSEE